jgi:hypothetical protein
MSLCKFTTGQGEHAHEIWINPLAVIAVTPAVRSGSVIALAVANGDSPYRWAVHEQPEEVAGVIADRIRWLNGTR